MNRRSFLQITALGCGQLFVRPASAKPPDRPRATSGLSRRKPVVLEEATISDLQAAMKSGQETAASLTKKYLQRIADIDRSGPALNAVIEINPEALAIARALDKERKAKGPRGLLHGVPILLKDNLDTGDRMMTTAGSLALLGSLAPRDSFVAQRLRAAGAVILGKTNLSEWANFRSSRSTSGWSGRGGQTKNPYALDRNPSGSSSGSAVAVAANLCAAAIGTETDGSIVSPASFNGIVGIKPTVGLVSRAGIIPIAQSQDTAGPMTRTVADAAILLSALAGTDSRDPSTEQSLGKSQADYTKFLDPRGLRGARIGLARKHFGLRAGADKIVEAAIETMKSCGAIVVDPADLPTHGKFEDSAFAVMLYEFKAGLNAYLAGLGPRAPARTLKEIIEFNERNKEKELLYFGQDTFIKAEAKGPLTERAYIDALEKNQRLSRDEGIDAVMNEHRLDAIVAPTTGPAHKIDLLYGDRDTGGSSTPAAVAGYPSITVPAGHDFELPVGVSFFGRAYSQPTLLKLASAIEQATKVRQPPKFSPTVG